MPKKPHNQLSIDIKGILSSCSRISDVRYINKRDEIIYLTSTNGVGELYRVDKSGNEEKLSKDLNVRGTIGYGGGGFDASPNLIVLTDINGDIYKINLSTNRTIKIASNNSQTASPKISPDGKWVIFVNEQNESAGIGILSLAGFSSPRQLVLGADFYMHPTWHPNGELVAWAEWDHPYMPWDASCIKIGQLGGK
jgi:Tol biopolymer transport system component